MSLVFLLSNDKDEEVRNWATFGLGTLIDINTPEICDALLARLSEENQEIRGEALVGLARRQHSDAKMYLKKELEGELINVLMLETAEILASEDLYPFLLVWKGVEIEDSDSYFDGCLEDALKACNPERQKE